jgi:hypothetical protein
LAAAGMKAIDEWWAELGRPARAEALHLWQDCNAAGSGLAVRVEATFVDEQDDSPHDFWHDDYYEYLVNHEIYLFDAPRFHICTRHPVAARAAQLGLIARGFACPFASGDCPMRNLLDLSPGRSVRLRVVVSRDEP